MNYFSSIEKLWYDTKNFKKTQIIQEYLKCCDFQSSIIDSSNECHHGFLPPCIKIFADKYSSNVSFIGISLILQCCSHFIISFLSFHFVYITSGAIIVEAYPEKSNVFHNDMQTSPSKELII